MKQVAIVSGKGGTGKTTVVASLAHLAQEVVTVDCDVDAANLALLLPGVDDDAQSFFAGQRAGVNPETCIGCGVCVSLCRFCAMHQTEQMLVQVDPLSCEGCGVCRLVCPTESVTLRPNQAGIWMVRQTTVGPLVHAALGVAQDNSGKLVARVREVARDLARSRGLDLVLIDGPPGIGCPVHAAVTGVDLLLAVTEPTPSGEHDLQRLLQLAEAFRLRPAVLINKADLSEHHTRSIEQLARRSGASLLGRLPFSTEVPRLLSRGKLPFPLPALAEELRKAWLHIHALILEPDGHAMERWA